MNSTSGRPPKQDGWLERLLFEVDAAPSFKEACRLVHAAHRDIGALPEPERELAQSILVDHLFAHDT
jgi:hypothetical protein